MAIGCFVLFGGVFLIQSSPSAYAVEQRSTGAHLQRQPLCIPFLPPGCGFRIGRDDQPQENQIFTDIIPNLLTWVYSLAAALGVLMGVISGVMFLVGGGNEETRIRAIKTLVYAIAGLLLALFAFFIVAVINMLPFPGT